MSDAGMCVAEGVWWWYGRPANEHRTASGGGGDGRGGGGDTTEGEGRGGTGNGGAATRGTNGLLGLSVRSQCSPRLIRWINMPGIDRRRLP